MSDSWNIDYFTYLLARVLVGRTNEAITLLEQVVADHERGVRSRAPEHTRWGEDSAQRGR
jgi:hypothetical protein